jgi:hypothetical protein
MRPGRRLTRRTVFLIVLALALIAAGVVVFIGVGPGADSGGSPATYLQAAWTQTAGLEYCDSWSAENLWPLSGQVVGCYGPASGATRMDQIADVSTDTGRVRWRWTEPAKPGTDNAGVSLSAETEDGVGAVLLDYSAPGSGPNAPSAAMALAGIDTASGRSAWQVDLPSATQPAGPGVQIGGGYAVVGLERSGTGTTMLVLDLHTGAVRWSLSLPTAGQDPNCGVESYAISAPSVYVAEFCDTANALKDTLVQYSLATGNALGSTPMSSSICGPNTGGDGASLWSAPGYVLAACAGPAEGNATGLDVIPAGTLTQHTLTLPVLDTSLENGSDAAGVFSPAFFITGTNLYIETSAGDATTLGVADIDLSALRIKWTASTSWGDLIGADNAGAIVQQSPIADWNADTYPVWLDHVASGSGSIAQGPGVERAVPHDTGVNTTLAGDVLLVFAVNQIRVPTTRAYNLTSWMNAAAGGTS